MAQTTLYSATITTALTAATFEPAMVGLDAYHGVLLFANFTYGSGGTTADAWVVTSADGGSTWYDIANFHFTTASAKALFTLRFDTPVTTQRTTFTTGSLAANTAVDGILGDRLGVIVTTTGTYAGSTTLVVSAIPTP